MEKSKTIKIINDFYSIIKKSNESELTEDERFFICTVEIELAKSIIQDFGEVTARKLGNIILSVIE